MHAIQKSIKSMQCSSFFDVALVNWSPGLRSPCVCTEQLCSVELAARCLNQPLIPLTAKTLKLITVTYIMLPPPHQ